MKHTFVRPALAAAIALALTACGGKAEFTIKGTINNLHNAGLQMKAVGQTIAPAAEATSFAFPTPVSYGDSFTVSFVAQPRHQHCGFDFQDNPASYTDTAGRLAEVALSVTCVQNSYALGGTVSGLTAEGLVLTNGSNTGTLTVLKNATTFTMPFPVADGSTYGITVLTQPTGLKCSVANGTGIMGEAAVNNVAVTCVPG